MMKLIRQAACALLAGAIAIAPAQSACWAGKDADAARVRELQTMLMVATLKCHAAGIDVTSAYNGFVAARRGALDAANAEIRLHFTAAGSGDAGYDSFATVLANDFGAEATDAAGCAEVERLAIDAAAGTVDLIRISEDRVPDRIRGGCPRRTGVTEMAAIDAPRATQAAPATAAKPREQIATTAALPASTAPAARGGLPPEVVAAMAVIASFAARQAQPGDAPAAGPDTTAMVQTAAQR